jgi:hypothetical protein
LVERDLAEPQALISLLRGGEAPAEIRAYAARRLLPLDAEDQIRALLAVVEDSDPATRAAAKESFATASHEELSLFLTQGNPTGIELDTLTRSTQDPMTLELIIRNKNIADETLETLARTVAGGAQEALVVNQARLLRQPSLIDALFENPELTADSRRRLLEVREEFFEKQQRRAEEKVRVAEEAAAAEAEAELEAEAARDLAALTPEEAAAITGAAAVEGDLLKSITTGAVYRRIAVMTVSEKIKLAYSGGKEERRILMGDANKLIGEAVLKSRGLTINEIESFCSMRHLNEEIFRKIAMNREWIRSNAVISSLVRNPKVPLAVTLPLIKHLNIRDLKGIVRDPNMAEGVRITARKWLEQKRR